MADNRIHKQYMQQDIQRYHSGEMTAAEMHALEKQALEDSLLADALDGYATLNAADARFDLDWLHQQLNEKAGAKVVTMQPKSATSLPWWKMAAAAAVMGVIFWAGNTMMNKGDTTAKNTTTANEAKVATKVDSISTAVAPANSNTLLDTASKPLKIVTTTDNQTASKVFVNPNDLAAYYSAIDSKEPIVNAALNSQQDIDKSFSKQQVFADTLNRGKQVLSADKDGDDDPLDNSVSSEPASVVSANAQPATPQGEFNNKENGLFRNTNYRNNSAVVFDSDKQAAKRAIQLKAKQENNISRDRNFMYTVVDPQGNPIPFVNISVPSDALVTYARADGKFGLFSTDSVLNINLKALGYVSKNVQLASSNAGRVIMEPEAKQHDGEVVVVGYGAKKEAKSAKPKVVIEDVEPVDGVSNYDAYVANNLNPGNNRGEVTLVFDLDDNGEPINVKVDKSLNIAADAEAVRLVTQGPKWKTKKRSKSKRAKITITF